MWAWRRKVILGRYSVLVYLLHSSLISTKSLCILRSYKGLTSENLSIKSDTNCLLFGRERVVKGKSYKS